MLLHIGVASASRVVARAADTDPGARTVLGVDGVRFTVNRRPVFLLGISCYGALGAPATFVRADLDDFAEHGFNWLRVWATWRAYETNVSAVTRAGLSREPFLGRLKFLVGECDRRGLVVDVSLACGTDLPGFAEHRAAVDTLLTALKPFRNW